MVTQCHLGVKQGPKILKIGTLAVFRLGNSNMSYTYDHTRICSNHFENGKPTYTNPIPTLFMTVQHEHTPKKRRKLHRDALCNLSPPLCVYATLSLSMEYNARVC